MCTKNFSCKDKLKHHIDVKHDNKKSSSKSKIKVKINGGLKYVLKLNVSINFNRISFTGAIFLVVQKHLQISITLNGILKMFI